MSKQFECALIIQHDGELAKYTYSLLDKIGYRHILQAKNQIEAKAILTNLAASSKHVDLIVIADTDFESACSFKDECRDIPRIVVSHPENSNNLNLISCFDLKQIIFLPFGRKQLERSILVQR